MCVEGVEADDVIGTLARQCAALGRDVVISTGDKDMAQLVCPHVTLVNTMTGSVYDIEGVKTKFGVGPELIIDFLALMGDKVDNIPGVPGVGEKTACGLLNGIPGGLKGLYEHLDQVAGLPIRGAKSLGAKLEEHRDAAFMSYELATIKIDVALDVEVGDLMPGEPHREALIALYRELEFKQWLDELLREAKAAGENCEVQPEGCSIQAEAQYETLLEQADFERWLARLKAAECFAFDTETTSLDAQRAELVGVSFAVEPGQAAYVPLRHSYMGVPQQLELDAVLGALAVAVDRCCPRAAAAPEGAEGEEPMTEPDPPAGEEGDVEGEVGESEHPVDICLELTMDDVSNCDPFPAPFKVITPKLDAYQTKNLLR